MGAIGGGRVKKIPPNRIVYHPITNRIQWGWETVTGLGSKRSETEKTGR